MFSRLNLSYFNQRLSSYVLELFSDYSLLLLNMPPYAQWRFRPSKNMYSKRKTLIQRTTFQIGHIKKIKYYWLASGIAISNFITFQIIFEEIFFALRTFEIDPSWFYLEFIVPPEKETSERIKENCKVLSHFYL